MLLQKQWAQQEEQRQRELVRQSWLTARFTGAAFAGKLRGLESYLAKSNSTRAPKVSRTEFDDLYAKAKGGDAHGAEESCG